MVQGWLAARQSSAIFNVSLTSESFFTFSDSNDVDLSQIQRCLYRKLILNILLLQIRIQCKWCCRLRVLCQEQSWRNKQENQCNNFTWVIFSRIGTYCYIPWGTNLKLLCQNCCKLNICVWNDTYPSKKYIILKTTTHSCKILTSNWNCCKIKVTFSCIIPLFFTFLLTDAPTITEPWLNYREVVEGSSIEIPCYAQGDLSLTYSWSVNGQQIFDSARR